MKAKSKFTAFVKNGAIALKIKKEREKWYVTSDLTNICSIYLKYFQFDVYVAKWKEK
jgi:hypothetical protein